MDLYEDGFWYKKIRFNGETINSTEECRTEICEKLCNGALKGCNYLNAPGSKIILRKKGKRPPIN